MPVTGVVVAATTNNGTVAGSIGGVGGGGGGGGGGNAVVRSSSNPNNISHQLNSSCSGGGGGSSLGLGSAHSNGSLPSGVVGLAPSSLMSGVGVVGSSVSGTNTVTAMGMISGASRPIPSAPVGINYPTHFQVS